MIDPYKVLGVSPGATPEEIKRAYRRKAKEYHPDLHPDDPDAGRKMNELNEAYNLLSNPEKFRARQQEQQSQNTYGGYGGYGGQGYGWSGDFSGFDFSDIFGAGFGTGYDTRPRPEAGDPPELIKAINALNAGRYNEALAILNNMSANYRNARWYYVCAVVYYELGDRRRAAEHIRAAVQMEPDNRIYNQLLQTIGQSGYQYGRSGGARVFSPFGCLIRAVLWMTAINLFTRIIRMLFSGVLR